MPIEGLSDRQQLPRLGKIRLGIKKVSPTTNKEYPAAVDYFVCPDEVRKVYGDTPRAIDVIIPVEDEEIWAAQYYRQYSRTRGLVCKGDGVTCRRMVDSQTGDVAGRNTKEIVWRENVECAGRECPDYQGKACQEVMNLQVILPKVPGLGIYQIDTGSIHSIMNINNCANMIRAMVGRVSWVPLTLTLEPTEVNNPDDGKKKTVFCMQLRYNKSVVDLLTESQKPKLNMLLGKPLEDEAPEDRLLTAHNPEKAEELAGKVETDIREYWPHPEDEPRLNKGQIIEAQGTVQPAAAAAPVDPDWQKMEQESNRLEAEAAAKAAAGGKPEPKKPAAKPKAAAAAPPAVVKPATAAKAARDANVLKTNMDMLKACFDDFGMQPPDVLKELNVASTNDLVDTPANSYLKIAAVRR